MKKWTTAMICVAALALLAPACGDFEPVGDEVTSTSQALQNVTYKTAKTSDKKQIAYRVIGNGPQDIVLVHGWSVSGAVYDNLIAELAGPDYRIIAVDLRGTGGSSKPSSGYTLDAYNKDLQAVLKDAKAINFILVGHSMGGAIAQQYAAVDSKCKDVTKNNYGQGKTCVKGLVLMSPVPASGFPLPDDIYGLFHASGEDPDLRRLILSISSPDMTQDDIEYVASAADSMPAVAVTESLAAWTGANFADKLHQIFSPTMVLVSDDPFMPVDLLQALVADPIDNAFVNYFPGSGHYLQVEDPVRTAAEIEAFINTLP